MQYITSAGVGHTEQCKIFAFFASESEIEMVAEETNLVDLVWPTEERPPYPQQPIYIHEIQFAGMKLNCTVSQSSLSYLWPLTIYLQRCVFDCCYVKALKP